MLPMLPNAKSLKAAEVRPACAKELNMLQMPVTTISRQRRPVCDVNGLSVPSTHCRTHLVQNAVDVPYQLGAAARRGLCLPGNCHWTIQHDTHSGGLHCCWLLCPAVTLRPLVSACAAADAIPRRGCGKLAAAKMEVVVKTHSLAQRSGYFKTGLNNLQQ